MVKNKNKIYIFSIDVDIINLVHFCSNLVKNVVVLGVAEKEGGLGGGRYQDNCFVNATTPILQNEEDTNVIISGNRLEHKKCWAMEQSQNMFFLF